MQPMQLGAFSVSLAVNDLDASRQWYEKLGFAAFAGDASKGWPQHLQALPPFVPRHHMNQR